MESVNLVLNLNLWRTLNEYF